jgi:hypothetical protein
MWKRSRSERGAILVHVAVIFLALLAFTALVFDYGVMFTSRRQAQNSADAAALSAAISYSLDRPGDVAAMQNSGVQAARDNHVWGQSPEVIAADIELLDGLSGRPPCPPGEVQQGVPGSCVKASVYRTGYGTRTGSPLPTFFANLFGVNEQGVRATATARLRAGSGTADCVKPWAIPDRWVDSTGTWDSTLEYNPPGDVYTPPSGNDLGTGYQLPRDYGIPLILKTGNPGGGSPFSAGYFFTLPLDCGSNSSSCYEANIRGCSNFQIDPNTQTQISGMNGNRSGPTRDAVGDLVALDQAAHWDPSANGGRGAPVGGCQETGACTRSPRWVAIPVFNPATFPGGGNPTLDIVKVLGFWVEGLVATGNGNGQHDVLGYLTHFPTLSITGDPQPGPSAWIRTIVLVR